MTGTTAEQTRTILCAPPKTTRPTKTVRMPPETQGAIPILWNGKAMELTCTKLPAQKAVKITATAKSIATFFNPNPLER